MVATSAIRVRRTSTVLRFVFVMAVAVWLGTVVSFSFPNCPDVLEDAFDFDLNQPRGVKVDRKHRSFAATGIGDLQGVKVAFAGRFIDRGAHAKGTYKVTEDSCTTGQKPWRIAAYKPPKS